jgi:NADH-quinone oxidoreductase subunit G
VGILEAAAAGKIDVLVLLGADPLSDFPDQGLATRAVAGARTVVAVDRFLTASANRADVVLAAAGFGEVDGTTTNLEGRVSTVARKVTPPGTARADWMIAAELARLLGTDLGITSPAAAATEIEALAPAYAGLTAEVLAGPAAHDGVVVPLPVEAPVAVEAPATDPAGAPGEGDAEGDQHQAADPSGAAEHMEGTPEALGDVPPPPSVPERPALLTYPPTAIADVPAVDAYSLRLVATRKLYDQGTTAQTSPSLAGLAPGGALRLHPHDFDRVGVAAGTTVTVTSPAGSAALPVHPDDGVPRGTAAVYLNQSGADVTALLDVNARVIDVRVLP